ncbi:glutamyl-tRNA(Gln) amidotransferase subunit B, mitochondrial [Brevipalpus obovatus]|uniref:glutamyl-tRNA(Gln) amidotransferase subunit B, mitochondrial n=1 Tax=Brevipalpus obovatus TaxID=246614 RepID=UPI003D9F9740
MLKYSSRVPQLLVRTSLSETNSVLCIRKCSNHRFTIGLEVHVQINSSSKLFSRSPQKFASPPNTNVSLFDCAIPGTLPVINHYCVEAAVRSGLALNCQINSNCCFDRKHYFYPDTPSGYQITQKREPIAFNGSIRFPVITTRNRSACLKRTRLKAIQLEQDTGKTLQDSKLERNLLDLNRCGFALMEFVFDPDLENEFEAVALIQELMNVLRRLDVCSCKLDEGAIRIDANISTNSGNKVEIKNLNSINSLSRALILESERQINLLEQGQEVVSETRTYDPTRDETFSMRRKDDFEDYRYMPEPNLPPLRLTFDSDSRHDDHQVVSVSRLRKSLPFFADQERETLLKKYQVPLYLACSIVRNGLFNFFVAVMDHNPRVNVDTVAEFIGFHYQACLSENGASNPDVVSPRFIFDCLTLIGDKQISVGTAVNAISLSIQGDSDSPKDIVEKHGWRMIQDENLIKEECLLVVNAFPRAALLAKRGAYLWHIKICEGVERKYDNQFPRSVVFATVKSVLESLDEKELRKNVQEYRKRMKKTAHQHAELEEMEKSNLF